MVNFVSKRQKQTILCH